MSEVSNIEHGSFGSPSSVHNTLKSLIDLVEEQQPVSIITYYREENGEVKIAYSDDTTVRDLEILRRVLDRLVNDLLFSVG